MVLWTRIISVIIQIMPRQRINISNAIIYYDMIYKTDHGFSNNNMNSDNSSSGANSVFAPPENKRTFGRHAA